LLAVANITTFFDFGNIFHLKIIVFYEVAFKCFILLALKTACIKKYSPYSRN